MTLTSERSVILRRFLLLTWSAAIRNLPGYVLADDGDDHDPDRSPNYRSQHAHAAEYLLPLLHPGSRVLDVGSGSGYLSAIFYHLASSEDKTGKVVGVEHINELVDWSVENMKNDGLGRAIEEKHIEMVAGDGRLGIFFLSFALSCDFLNVLPLCLGYPSGGE